MEAIPFKRLLISALLAMPGLGSHALETDSMPPTSEQGMIAAAANARAQMASVGVATGTAVNANSSNTLRRELAGIQPMSIPYIRSYVESNRRYVIRMRETGAAHLYTIERVLESHQLPLELKYLAMVESNLKMSTVSKMGASGIWQLMPHTAKALGLRVGGGVDERFDLRKSTHAAARHIKTLYGQFGDWLLVIAAYNSGPGRIQSAITRSGSRNFWKMQGYLPIETSSHVKKFIAIHHIMEGTGSPSPFMGDAVAVVKPSLPEETRTQSVSGKYHSSVMVAALGMEPAVFNTLNPDFDAKVGTETYLLSLPAEKMPVFEAKKQDILAASVEYILGGDRRYDKDRFPGVITLPPVKKPAQD